MWMSESEIRLLYKEAKNQKKEITILSELNACSEKDIEKIILKGGMSLPVPKERRKTCQEQEQTGVETAEDTGNQVETVIV